MTRKQRQVVAEPKLIIKDWNRMKLETDKGKEVEEMFSAASLLPGSFLDMVLMLIYLKH